MPISMIPVRVDCVLQRMHHTVVTTDEQSAVISIPRPASRLHSAQDFVSATPTCLMAVCYVLGGSDAADLDSAVLSGSRYSI